MSSQNLFIFSCSYKSFNKSLNDLAIENFVENAPKSLGITRFVIIFASEIHLNTYGFTMSSSKFTPKTRHLGNQEIIEGLVNGRTEAFYSIYSILENVLAHFRVGSNAVLVHECITTKESLLSYLYDRGKFSKETIEGQNITNIDKWIWSVASRELISLLRSKKKSLFVKSFQSIDSYEDYKASTVLRDKVNDIADESTEIDPKDKFDVVVKYLKSMKVDYRYEVIFYGLAQGDDKKKILPEFIKAAEVCGKTLTDESRYAANYDLVYHRWNKTLNTRIPYRQIVSELVR